jgi:hypothetical protein
MHAILKDKIFGPCAAHVYAIEFQKRGTTTHASALMFEEQI